MSETWYLVAGISIASAITWLLRATPFAMLAPLRKSALLTFVGERAPVGIMLILTVYTLRNIDPVTVSAVGPAVLALSITTGLQVWRGNMILSIFTGTAAYVVLASVIAATG